MSNQLYEIIEESNAPSIIPKDWIKAGDDTKYFYLRPYVPSPFIEGSRQVSLGELFQTAIINTVFSYEHLAAQCDLKSRMNDILNDRVCINNIPVVLVSQMVRLLSIPFDQFKKSAIVSYNELKQYQQDNKVEKHPWTTLWENEAALGKYLNRLKEILDDHHTPKTALSDRGMGSNSIIARRVRLDQNTPADFVDGVESSEQRVGVNDKLNKVVFALQELLYLKTIKEMPGCEEEYKEKKPLAWEMAREALKYVLLPYSKWERMQEPTAEDTPFLTLLQQYTLEAMRFVDPTFYRDNFEKVYADHEKANHELIEKMISQVRPIDEPKIKHALISIWDSAIAWVDNLKEGDEGCSPDLETSITNALNELYE